MFLVSASFSGKNVNVTPFSDHHCLSIEWNKGVPGKTWDGIAIISWRNENPDFGSQRSNIRLVDISQVVHEPSLELRADCLAMREAYFCLLLEDKIVLKGGTNLIFVPSGKFFADDPYQFDNFCLTSWALSAAPSRCRAWTLVELLSLLLLEPSVVRIGFHFAPFFSPVSKETISAILPSSCCLEEYSSQPMSVASSWSEALG